MTSVTKIRKGDTFWCFHRKAGSPMLGIVIALTTEPSKQIGLEFESEMGGHSCDGRGTDGRCLWVRRDDIMTEAEYEAHLEMARINAENAANIREVEELTF